MIFTNSFRKAAPLYASALALSLMFAITEALVPAPAMSGNILKSGTFVGQSDHITTGKVTIERTGDRILVVLAEDFSLDGAPAPTLGFSNGAKFDKSSEFAKLKKLKGRQVYELPKNFALASYDTFTLWCSKFSVPLGKAVLK